MGKDMQRMMKQAQKMAADMQKAQEALAEDRGRGQCGRRCREGGGYRRPADGLGHHERRFFEGEPDADDLEMLGDTVTAAVNDALDKAREAQAEALGPLAGGARGPRPPGHVRAEASIVRRPTSDGSSTSLPSSRHRPQERSACRLLHPQDFAEPRRVR